MDVHGVSLLRLLALYGAVLELKDTLTYSGVYWVGALMRHSHSIFIAPQSKLCTHRLFECVIAASHVSRRPNSQCG
jgi:hypothetical protein